LPILGLLKALKVKALSADGDEDASAIQHLLNLYSRIFIRQCDNAACRRMAAIYGPCVAHSQLNTATHEALCAQYGAIDVQLLKCLAQMVRAGHIVNEQGKVVYLPHLSRLTLPITIIQGANNQLFLPQGSATTIDLLRKIKKDVPYRHVV